ncbi:hypothetical protein ASF61_06630 [Duganella sp. Leaf126]|uniref:hypothetical protein n=1 Tax=Duganella sp. Leaf126 TaxID=1736266 RepID=UPI000700788F|nr:hypothetical protein [Duganella sp. Leaf126]KQQ40423.1 hypothetical protein ASF61_06630 [Duganella sp. Leaf126]
MSITNNGGPAFPSLEATVTGIDSDGQERIDTEAYGGMSMRDYFAVRALAPMIENKTKGSCEYRNEQEIATRAYAFADAMLAERAK